MNVIVHANENGFREVNRMCDALLEIVKDEFKDELEEYKALGKAIGLSEGKAIGITQGKQEQLSSMIAKKITKGKSLEQIADELEETVDEILPLYQQLLSKTQNI